MHGTTSRLSRVRTQATRKLLTNGGISEHTNFLSVHIKQKGDASKQSIQFRFTYETPDYQYMIAGLRSDDTSWEDLVGTFPTLQGAAGYLRRNYFKPKSVGEWWYNNTRIISRIEPMDLTHYGDFEWNENHRWCISMMELSIRCGNTSKISQMEARPTASQPEAKGTPKPGCHSPDYSKGQ